MPSTGNPFWDALVALVGLAGSAVGVAAVIKGGRRANREADQVTELTPYTAIVDRVMYLEQRDVDKDKQISVLRSDVDHLRSSEGRLIAWVVSLHRGINDGSIPPIPETPPWLELLLAVEPDDR